MIQDIDSISFGVYSAEQVKRISVAKINSSKKNIEHGTVYDPRMGATDSGNVCETCKENAINCPGHFGHIELEQPVPHPLYNKKDNRIFEFGLFFMLSIINSRGSD